MSIPVTEEHEALAESVGRWATDRCPEDVPQATFDAETDELPAIWEDMANQGWLGIHLPEEHGGVGYGLEELAVVLEQLGRAAVPGPFLPTVLAGELIRRAGSDAAKGELLPAIADGSRPAAVDLQGKLELQRDGDGITVSGTASPVMSAAVAKSLVLGGTVDGEDVWVVVDAADATITELKSFDGSRREAKVELDGVSVPADKVLSGLTTEQVRDLAVVLFAAEAAGITGWTIDTAAEYAKVREQFGRPIGQFQGVKHRCANMLVRTEQARGTAWDAARAAVNDDLGELRQPASVAGAIALESSFENAKDCIQVLGGIGITWEHDAHLYLRRAYGIGQFLGGPARWLRRTAELTQDGVRRDLGIDLSEVEGLRPEIADAVAAVAALADDERQAKLAEAGLLAPHWPAPYGRGAGPAEQLLIDQEMASADVTRPDLVIGWWAAPTILEHGTPGQIEQFVPGTLRGEIFWCQLFSEPGAGSDLAGLTTKATKVDGGWRITGQKIWTTGAQFSQWGALLARTNPSAPKHNGITYFLLDMKSEGVEVKPLRELTGGAMFNTVFIDDVFVPDELVLGEVDRGWEVSRNTLTAERVSIGSSEAPFLASLDQFVEFVRTGHFDQIAQNRAGQLIAEGHAAKVLNLRSTLLTLAGGDAMPSAAISKLLSMRTGQGYAEFGVSSFGVEGAVGDPDQPSGKWTEYLLASRATTIYGGTSEVQLNIIAERLLGLPRDP